MWCVLVGRCFRLLLRGSAFALVAAGLTQSRGAKRYLSTTPRVDQMSDTAPFFLKIPN